MRPSNFRATAILCIAILVADAVVAQLPHSHGHAHAADGACQASHPCGAHVHVHHAVSTPATCSHHHCSHGCPTSHDAASQPTSESQAPCDDCTLCRHQGQAALACTPPPVLSFLTLCSPVVDRQVAQISSLTPRVYQGRGPPGSL